MVLILCGVSGCASTPRPSIGTPDSYRFVARSEGVAVAAEPILDDAQLRRLLTKSPPRNILAVRVIIFNQSDSVVRFSYTQAKLQLSDAVTFSAIPPSEIAKDLEANEGAAAQIIVTTTGIYGAGIAAAISNSAAEDNWRTQAASRKCSLELATLNPGEALDGYLFYKFPQARAHYVRSGTVAILKIGRMPRPNADPLTFSIPMSLGTAKEEKH